MPSTVSCEWCYRDFPTKAAKSQHIGKSQSCSKKRLRAFKRLNRTLNPHGQLNLPAPPLDNSAADKENEPPFDEADLAPPILITSNISATSPNSPATTTPPFDQNAQPPSHRARVEEVPEPVPTSQRFVESFPASKLAGASFGESQTIFEAIRDDQILRGAEILGPFKTDEEWQLAKWLIKNVGHNATEQFLKLAVVSVQLLSEE